MSLFRLTRKVSTALSYATLHIAKASGVCFSTAKPTVLSACSAFRSNIKPPIPSSLMKLGSTGCFNTMWPSVLRGSQNFNLMSVRTITLEYMHAKGLYKKERKKKNSPLEGRPQLRGVVLKTLIKKPKKPNSANRKCVKVRLSTGKEALAYVPGEGHNLQEHNIVLVQGGKLQDTPGVKLVCVRGKYDLPHVKKR